MNRTILLLVIYLTGWFFFACDTPVFASNCKDSTTKNTIHLAVMTNDYLLLPVAVYQTREWRKNWPGFGSENFSIDHPPAIEIPSSMYFKTCAGDSGIIQLTEPGIVTNCADASWVYFSNRSVTPKPFVPKAGENPDIAGKYLCMATNQKLDVLFDKPVDSSSRIIKEIKSAISVHMSDLEDQKLAEKLKDARDSVIPEVSVCEIPLSKNGIRVFKFVAEKSYATISPRNNIRCPDVVQFSGWVLLTRDNRSIIVDREFRLTDCDSDSFSWVCLGCFQIDDRIFWIGHMRYYESDLIELYEVSSQMVSKLLEISGGGC